MSSRVSFQRSVSYDLLANCLALPALFSAARGFRLWHLGAGMGGRRIEMPPSLLVGENNSQPQPQRQCGKMVLLSIYASYFVAFTVCSCRRNESRETHNTSIVSLGFDHKFRYRETFHPKLRLQHLLSFCFNRTHPTC